MTSSYIVKKGHCFEVGKPSGDFYLSSKRLSPSKMLFLKKIDVIAYRLYHSSLISDQSYQVPYLKAE